jgi:hypothetical protein
MRYTKRSTGLVEQLTRTPGGIMTKQEQIADLKDRWLAAFYKGRWSDMERIDSEIAKLSALPIEKEVGQ